MNFTIRLFVVTVCSARLFCPLGLHTVNPPADTSFDILTTSCRRLCCIVVGSRRLMPPDALQPNAYCTNPGLQSFLFAPPGVSTRDPSSEWRNYLGEKWPVRLPRINFRLLLHAANMRHGTNCFTSLPKEGVLTIFSP